MSIQPTPMDVASLCRQIPNAQPNKEWDDRWQTDEQSTLIEKRGLSKNSWRFSEMDFEIYFDCTRATRAKFFSLTSDAFIRANPDELSPWISFFSYREKKEQFEVFEVPILQAWSLQFNIPAKSSNPWKPNDNLYQIAYETYKEKGERMRRKVKLGNQREKRGARSTPGSQKESAIQISSSPAEKPKHTTTTTIPVDASTQTLDLILSDLVRDERHMRLICTLKKRKPRIDPPKTMLYQVFFTDVEPQVQDSVLQKMAEGRIIQSTDVSKTQDSPNSMDIVRLQQMIKSMPDMHYDERHHRMCMIGTGPDGFTSKVIVTDHDLTIWTELLGSSGTFPIVIVVCRPEPERLPEG
ncbi:MAG: hypothetical protein M1822_003403 [Bathelium mastoideum]|nr:MAG: hypothetical protein M1822_003403 [Bathelium mastoideum]